MSLDPLPKADRGFEVDYTGFILPGGHEATLCIGWAPGRAGNVREKIGVKYGSCRTQIVLAGGCEAPKEKRTTVVPAPSFAQKRAPLRSSNRVKQAGGISGKKGESMPAKASEAQIPKNPVEKAEGQPTFAPMRSSPDNAENVPPKVAMMTAKALKVNERIIRAKSQFSKIQSDNLNIVCHRFRRSQIFPGLHKSYSKRSLSNPVSYLRRPARTKRYKIKMDRNMTTSLPSPLLTWGPISQPWALRILICGERRSSWMIHPLSVQPLPRPR